MWFRVCHDQSIRLMLLFLFFMGYASNVNAENLGVRGSIYTIVESDLLDGIYQRLTVMQKKGELARENQIVLKQTIQKIIRPTPVQGVSDLPKGQKPRIRYFDPSIVLNHDIRNTNGNVIAKKGMRLNPLDFIHFDEKLFFINGDNNQQRQWLKKEILLEEKSGQRIKIILVKGNLYQFYNALQHRVYFDQHGVLCRHFQITRTPTVIYQPNTKKPRIKRLVIEEVSVD